MMILRWIVAGIVMLVLAATLLIDLMNERRPRGGWVYRCEARAALAGGDANALRLLGEYGQPHDADPESISWAARSDGRAALGLSIQWGAPMAGDIIRNGSTDGEVILELQPRRPGRSGHFTVRRLGAARSQPGPVAETAMKPDEGVAFFRLDHILAFAAGDSLLLWSYESSDPPAAPVSGTIDVAGLREAAASLPGLRRQLDAEAARFATACTRRAASAAYRE